MGLGVVFILAMTGMAASQDSGRTEPPVPLVRCPQADSTNEARTAHMAGYTVLSLTVDENGLPSDIHVVKPIGMGEDENAVACLARWRFRPAEKGGKPIPIQEKVTLGYGALDSVDWHVISASFLTHEGVTRPVVLNAPVPSGSADRRTMTICLHLTIDKGGIPRDLQVAVPHDLKLDREAIAVVSAWRFQPAMKAGHPVEVTAIFNLVHGNTLPKP